MSDREPEPIIKPVHGDWIQGFGETGEYRIECKKCGFIITGSYTSMFMYEPHKKDICERWTINEVMFS